MAKWPDLDRHGWRLSIVRRAGKVAGLRLERVRPGAAPVNRESLRNSGFVVPMDHGKAGYAIELQTLQLRMTDLKSWLPAFDPDVDTQEAMPKMVEESAYDNLRHVDPRVYPEEADVTAIDTEAGIRSIEMSREVFDRAVKRRTVEVLSFDDEKTLFTKVMHAAPHLSEREARSAAHSALEAIRESDSSLHAIDQVGSAVFSPPLRFYKDDYPAHQLANWSLLQMDAIRRGLLDRLPDEFSIRFNFDDLDPSRDGGSYWDGLSGNQACLFLQSLEDADLPRVMVIHEGLGQAVTEYFVRDRELRRAVQPSLFNDDWRGGVPMLQGGDTPVVRHWTTGEILQAYDGIAYEPTAGAFFLTRLVNGERVVAFLPGANFAEAKARVSEAELALRGDSAPDVALEEQRAAEINPPVPPADEIDVSDKAGGSDRIEDVGEKIGGARKDFYRSPLKVADLDSMNEREVREAIVLKNIWPFSLRKMKEEGGSVAVATFLRDMRRNVGKPTDRWGPEAIKRYVQVLSLLNESLSDVKTRDDLLAGLRRFRNEIERQNIGTYGTLNWRGDRYTQEYMSRDGEEELGTGELVMWSKYSRLESSPASIEAAWAKLLPTRTRTDPGQEGPTAPDRPHLEFLRFKGPQGEDIDVGMRNGMDIAAEDLLSVFGFRAVEFGNWLPQDERQRVINYAYDGLMMLAKTMDVRPSALSLNGRLALAFGARGVSRAAAHYEPARRVINLTRMKGAGSLAHEFWHALDDALGQLFGKNTFATKEFANQGNSMPGANGAVQSWVGYLMGCIHRRPMTEDEIRERYQIGCERGDSYAKSWIKWDLISRFQVDKGMDRGQAVQEAEGYLNDLFSTAKNRCADEGGGFNALSASEFIERSVKVTHGLKLKKKAREQLHACLASESRDMRALARLSAPSEDPERIQLFEQSKTGSSYYFNAKKLDANRAGTYWSQEIELSARAFESYIFDRLQANGMCADYLVHGVEGSRFAGAEYSGNPYPAGAEREAINRAFEGLMVAIKQHMEMGDFVCPDRSVQADTLKLAASF